MDQVRVCGSTIYPLHFSFVDIKRDLWEWFFSSHFWTLKTPCLWPLGMRSWEGLRCPGTDCPRQTSRFRNPPQHTGYLRLKTENRFFICVRECEILDLASSVFQYYRIMLNGWLACLRVEIAASQRKSWKTACQQQKASWSCSRSSCHCGEERSSLISDEHSHAATLLSKRSRPTHILDSKYYHWLFLFRTQ